MSDQLLGVLKIALLALLYLFFARVLWAVWSEVRGPRPGRQVVVHQHQARAATAPGAADPTMPGAAPPVATTPNRVKRAKRGVATKLVVLVPKERKGATFPVGGEITIGRATTCTISIPDDTFVSQLHVRLYHEGDELIVEDLGSTNGSYLNGTRLTTAQPFHTGDRLQVGSTVLEGE